MSSETSSPKKKRKQENVEGIERQSISVRLVRHAESMNNQVYRKAHKMFKSGTPDFDLKKWKKYVEEHRLADPGLSDRGSQQAEKLAAYLVPNLLYQASNPVRFIVSPMQRALETLIPTLEQLNVGNNEYQKSTKTRVIVNAFYTESEGCHLSGKAEPGKNQVEVSNLLPESCAPLSFVGYTDDPNDGWYTNRSGPESRLESEERAAKFFLWLCEYLDKELESKDDHKESQSDLFDAGVALEGEECEDEYDKLSPRRRRRRTVVLVGHGDFMSLVLKRIVASVGYHVEIENLPHRSAFVHYNTGITDLEYYGSGRFLVMSQNHIPHLIEPKDYSLRSGGGLKDGWAYLMPHESKLTQMEVLTYTHESEMDGYIKEQTEAMKSLYSKPSTFKKFKLTSSKDDGMKPKVKVVQRFFSGNPFGVTSQKDGSNVARDRINEKVKFVVKRGFEVCGYVSYLGNENSLEDFVIRPSVGKNNDVVGFLVHALRLYLESIGNLCEKGSVLVELKSASDQCQSCLQHLI